MWRITSWFGQRDSAHVTHSHQGIDVGMPMDTPVRSLDSGTVERITHEGVHGFGNAVWIKEPDGYRIVLGHLDRIYVQPGEKVYGHEVIALSGNSGHSTGPHLHIGVQNPQGQWIDPSEHLNLPWIGWTDHVKQWEANRIASPVAGTIEDIVKQLASDFGHWVMHIIGPVALVVCCIFLLGVILGVEKAPKRAMIWGVIASMGYGIDAQ